MTRHLLALLIAIPLLAQDDIPAGGRGGRGGRGSTRDFLGLGAAPDPVAAARGEKLYAPSCAFCHGEKARGAEGPNLVRSPIVLHDEKGETIRPRPPQRPPPTACPPSPPSPPPKSPTSPNSSTCRSNWSPTAAPTNASTSSPATPRPARSTSKARAAADLPLRHRRHRQARPQQNRDPLPGRRPPEPIRLARRRRLRWRRPRRAPNHHRHPAQRQAHHRHPQTNGRHQRLHVRFRRGVSPLLPPRSASKSTRKTSSPDTAPYSPKYTDADMHNLTAYLVTLK